MKRLMETQIISPIDLTAPSRKKSGYLEREIISSKGLLFQSRNSLGGNCKNMIKAKGIKQIDGIQCSDVENRIKPQFKNDSNYPRSIAYFREDNGMLQKWELFGDSDKLEKVIYADELKKIQGNWTVTIARVEDLKKKGNWF